MGRHENGGKALKHVHDYQLTRTRTETVEGRITVFRFYVCINRDTPCPERDKMEIEHK